MATNYIVTKASWYKFPLEVNIAGITESFRNSFNIKQSPIDLKELLSKMKICLRCNTMPHGYEGSIEKTVDGFILTINPSGHRGRNRFTIAHEIGHIILDELTAKAPKGEVKTLKEKWQIEKFCDKFASHLLVPDSSIESVAQWNDFSIQKIIDKSREFSVSISVFLNRFLEFALYNGAGQIWLNRMGKPTNQREFLWRLSVGQFPKLEKYYLPKYDSISEDSPILAVLDTNKELYLEDIHIDFGSIRGKYSILLKTMNTSNSIDQFKNITPIDNNAILMVILPKEVRSEHLDSKYVQAKNREYTCNSYFHNKGLDTQLEILS